MNLPVSNHLIDLGALIVLIVVILGIGDRARKGSLHHFFHWDVLKSSKGIHSSQKPSLASSIVRVLFRDVFTVRELETCSRTKRVSHLLIFWGFVFLGISTVLAFLLNPNNLILPLYNPVKIFGNAGGILVVGGFIGMFYVRYQERRSIWKITRSDVFLLSLFFTVITGFIVQQAIYSALGAFWISATFWTHIVLITFLLASAPYTKFYHAISKPVSLLYEEIDRKGSVEPLLPGENTISSSEKE